MNSTLAILAALSALRLDMATLRGEVRDLVRDVLEEERAALEEEAGGLAEVHRSLAKTKEETEGMLREMKEMRLMLLEERATLKAETSRLEVNTRLEIWAGIRSPQAALWLLQIGWNLSGGYCLCSIFLAFVADWSTTLLIGIGYLSYLVATAFANSRFAGWFHWCWRTLCPCQRTGSSSERLQPTGETDEADATTNNSSWFSWFRGAPSEPTDIQRSVTPPPASDEGVGVSGGVGRVVTV